MKTIMTTTRFLLVGALFCAVSSVALAQVRPMTGDTAKPHPMAHGGGMAGMMAGPHHALAMAYHDNLATFARALTAGTSEAKAVDLELARPATAEMRRSFDQMKLHHQANMSTMGTQMTSPMSRDSAMARMMRDMPARVAAIDMHLGALETEVALATPSAAKVLEHTMQILKQCDGMMQMPARAPARPAH